MVGKRVNEEIVKGARSAKTDAQKKRLERNCLPQTKEKPTRHPGFIAQYIFSESAATPCILSIKRERNKKGGGEQENQ